MQNKNDSDERKYLVEKTYEWPPPNNGRSQVYVSLCRISNIILKRHAKFDNLESLGNVWEHLRERTKFLPFHTHA